MVALARAGVPPRGGREVADRRVGRARRDEAGVGDAEARRAALLPVLRLDGAHEIARHGRNSRSSEEGAFTHQNPPLRLVVVLPVLLSFWDVFPVFIVLARHALLHRMM